MSVQMEGMGMASGSVAIGSDCLQCQDDTGSVDSSSSSSRSNNGLGGIPSPPESPATCNRTQNGHNHSQKSTAVKFKLLHEGDVQICRLNHTRTIISKIMNSRYLRRWESQHVILGDNDITATAVCSSSTLIDLMISFHKTKISV